MSPIHIEAEIVGAGQDPFLLQKKHDLPDAEKPVPLPVANLIVLWNVAAMAANSSGAGRLDIKEQLVGPPLRTFELTHVQQELGQATMNNSGTYTRDGVTIRFKRVP